MKILVDENIPRMTVERLREVGHNVRDVRGMPDQGLEDPDLWTTVVEERRVLITTDRGFTEYRRIRNLDRSTTATQSPEDSSSSHARAGAVP